MKTIPIRQLNPPDDSLSTGQFKIRELSQVLNGKDLLHGLHRHDFYFILLIKNGGGRHEIDFETYGIPDNSIFMLRPGQVHQLELKAISTGFILEFHPAFYQPRDILSGQRLRRAFSRNFCVSEARKQERMLSLFSCMQREFDLKQDGYADIIKASLEIFMIEYIRESRNSDGLRKQDNPYTHERYEQFIELVNQNISSKKQVSQYAGLLNISSYQLNSITKMAVGKSASELISDQIILEAKRLLVATTSQIKEIADTLGYDDISYFIRFFKKHTGYSPEAFRRK